MNTEVIKLDNEKPDLRKIKQAAEIVDSGGLVAFPTETVYGIACRVEKESLARLNEIKGRNADKYYTLHVANPVELAKYVPRVPLLAAKLISRAWPGPLTVILELDEQNLRSQRKKLSRDLCRFLYRDHSIGIRCPDNAIASNLLSAASSPVVAPSANTAGSEPATNAEQVLTMLDGRIEMVLDGGQCEIGTSSTVVKVTEKGCQILRKGCCSESQVAAMATVNILLVCTGNTCRSPMAAGICRKYIAKKIRSKVDQLDKIGYKILSAGVMAIPDMPASTEAVKVCAEKNVDITSHRSRTVRSEILAGMDHVFVMSQNHLDYVTKMEPRVAEKCILLDKSGDIADPIFGGEVVYRRCFEQIDKAVQERLSGVL